MFTFYGGFVRNADLKPGQIVRLWFTEQSPKATLVAAVIILASKTPGERFQPDVKAPNGYRLPTERDLTGGWKDNRDQLWLLPRTSGKGFGLFAFLGARIGQPKSILLTSARSLEPQSYGIEVAQPDRYETAGGKGYGDFACAHGEPDVLDLKLAGIWFSLFENSSSIFWWDTTAKKFQRTLMSD